MSLRTVTSRLSGRAEYIHRGLPLEVVEVPLPASGFRSSVEELAPYLGDDLACLVVQYPNFYGAIEDIEAMAELAHASGGALVVASSPFPSRCCGHRASSARMSLPRKATPRRPQSFGGPYVGLLAARQSYVRQMPGRLAGLTSDSEGKRVSC